MKEILAIDDNEEILKIIKIKLELSGFKVFTESDSTNVLDNIQTNYYDCILLDWMMPGMTGLEILIKIREFYSSEILPVIFLTCKNDTESTVAAYENGANDYVLKPINFPVLEKRIITQILLNENIKNAKSQNLELALKNEELNKLNQELNLTNKALKQSALQVAEFNKVVNELAITDTLTKVYNRNHFYQILNKLILNFKRRRKEQHIKHSVTILDIDFFKKVNDKYGHLAGDFILKEFCNIIKKNIREDDLLARYGGEEFVILFKECNKNEALNKLNKVLDIIRKFIFNFEDKEIQITFSGGLAEIKIDDIVDDILERADKNLYIAKKNGRNQIVI